ncbi:hypothetical protein NXY56_004547 [Leishmania guyanensis]|uniref:Uncharacterized protein n=1 Tax=Leishmania guyanensis TaxID=5670 RepID=A0A1E1J2U1_LEIGU|nr:hypothetical protein, conserved [Leishmania guyanensis]
MNTTTEKVTISFNTSRFGVKVADGSFDPDTTIGEVHARLRKKLVKAKAMTVPVTSGGLEGVTAISTSTPTSGSGATFIFVRNGTEAFIPAPEQTLQTLLDMYATTPEARKLYITIDPEVFSG